MTTIFQLLNNKVEVFPLPLHPPSPTSTGQSLKARTLPWLIKREKTRRLLDFPEVTQRGTNGGTRVSQRQADGRGKGSPKSEVLSAKLWLLAQAPRPLKPDFGKASGCLIVQGY